MESTKFPLTDEVVFFCISCKLGENSYLNMFRLVRPYVPSSSISTKFYLMRFPKNIIFPVSVYAVVCLKVISNPKIPSSFHYPDLLSLPAHMYLQRQLDYSQFPQFVISRASLILFCDLFLILRYTS